MKRPLLVALATTVAAAGVLLFGAGSAAAATISHPADLANASTSAIRPSSGGGCTGASTEVCFGINGSGDVVNWMQVQAFASAAGTVSEWITGPNGGQIGPVDTFHVSGPGWVPADRVTLNQDVAVGWYCGHASFDQIAVPDYCVLVS